MAIKVFSPDLSETDRERLRREVRWGRTLQHPGLVRLYELVESDGRLALVMEWLGFFISTLLLFIFLLGVCQSFNYRP